MRDKLQRFLLGFLLALCGVATAGVLYPYFGPVTGILKGSVSTPQTSAAAASDVISLWSGTCNSSTVLGGNGSCVTPTGCTIEAPTASVGLSAVTGATGDCMDAGSAPPLSQAIAPLWSATHTWTNNNPLAANCSGGTAYTAINLADASNNLDIEALCTGDLVLEAATSAGTGVKGAQLVPENSTYSQFQVSDAAGNLQNAGYLGAPQNPQTISYTLALSDRGKSILEETASTTITVPANLFSPGDIVIIVCSVGSGSITIAAASGQSIYWATGTGLTEGSRTCSNIGVATLYFQTSNIVLLTGSGIS